MEYILINESKLKIICEEHELELYGVSADSLEYGDASSRKFLDDLLKEAKSKLKFESAKHRILIQLYPCKDGGCEIFISKLDLAKKEENIKKTPNAKSKETIKKLFFFEKLDFLLEACKRISFLQHSNSSAFYLEERGYYLYFEICDMPKIKESDELEEYGIPMLDEYSFLFEYGEAQNVKEELPYLKEYAKIICEQKAIEKLNAI